jgi:hypothetical protein
MTTPVFGPERESFADPVQPASLEDIAGLLDQASFVVLDPECASKLSGDVARAGFTLGASRLQINPRRRTKLQLYVKAWPSRRP